MWLCSIFQRYNLKAIHNVIACAPVAVIAVFNISKIQSKSNSQLLTPFQGQGNSCVQYFKDTI